MRGLWCLFTIFFVYFFSKAYTYNVCFGRNRDEIRIKKSWHFYGWYTFFVIICLIPCLWMGSAIGEDDTWEIMSDYVTLSKNSDEYNLTNEYYNNKMIDKYEKTLSFFDDNASTYRTKQTIIADVEFINKLIKERLIIHKSFKSTNVYLGSEVKMIDANTFNMLYEGEIIGTIIINRWLSFKEYVFFLNSDKIDEIATILSPTN